jgi:hypothetical protein
VNDNLRLEATKLLLELMGMHKNKTHVSWNLNIMQILYGTNK